MFSEFLWNLNLNLNYTIYFYLYMVRISYNHCHKIYLFRTVQVQRVRFCSWFARSKNKKRKFFAYTYTNTYSKRFSRCMSSSLQREIHLYLINVYCPNPASKIHVLAIKIFSILSNLECGLKLKIIWLRGVIFFPLS